MDTDIEDVEYSDAPEVDVQTGEGSSYASDAGIGNTAGRENDWLLALKITERIRKDKAYHEKAFKRMREDMQMAMWGADEDWAKSDKYKANISGRHVKQKTAALYAKNPKVRARRRDTLDFTVWDETPASLQLAYQTVMQARVSQANPAVPMQMPVGFDEAMRVIEDFRQGTERRTFLTKLGKTMEVLFANAMWEQKPLDFKQSMKALVRRACTTGVAYCEVGFQRQMGKRPESVNKLADDRARLEHMNALYEKLAEGEADRDSAERAELEAAIRALESEGEIVLREGLVFDFPQSTKVIPDKCTRSLAGFVGARHITIEYEYSRTDVKEMFGVDVGNRYRRYSIQDEEDTENGRNEGFIRVWKHYDKKSGLVYHLAEGYDGFLAPPAPPDVKVEDFWPLYALCFNAVESEKELFPPSDVSLIRDMQNEHNRSRQGKREHRIAARPRWVYSNGVFSNEDDPLLLRDLRPFESLGLNIDSQADIRRVLQVVPVPGVDPNLYDTGEVFQDTQLVVGTQQSMLGGLSRATATEVSVAANSANSADGVAIDDLDSFLTMIARASGQIMLREYSPETVMRIAGVGAVWPQAVTEEDNVTELALEIEAGSTGKPNQAVEIQNMQRLAPLLMQIPGLDSTWMLKQMLMRMDDRLDLAEAVASGIPSIVAQNQQIMSQQNQGAGTTSPENNPAAQGAAGAQNAPMPDRPVGTMAAMGDNAEGLTPEAAI